MNWRCDTTNARILRESARSVESAKAPPSENIRRRMVLRFYRTMELMIETTTWFAHHSRYAFECVRACVCVLSVRARPAILFEWMLPYTVCACVYVCGFNTSTWIGQCCRWLGVDVHLYATFTMLFWAYEFVYGLHVISALCCSLMLPNFIAHKQRVQFVCSMPSSGICTARCVWVLKSIPRAAVCGARSEPVPICILAARWIRLRNVHKSSLQF